MADQQHKVPGVVEQKLISAKTAEEIEKGTNSFILEATKKKWQITSISHMVWGEKLVVVISYLRPLKQEELPADVEIKEL